MTDLRELMAGMLDDEPLLPDIADRVILDGQRARRRRNATHWAAGIGTAALVTAVAIPIAIGVTHNNRRNSTQQVAVSPSPQDTTSIPLTSVGIATQSWSSARFKIDYAPPTGTDDSVSAQAALTVALNSKNMLHGSTSASAILVSASQADSTPADAWIITLTGGCVEVPPKIGKTADNSTGAPLKPRCVTADENSVVDANTGAPLYSFGGGGVPNFATVLAPQRFAN